MRSETKISRYVAAVQELHRLRELTPTEEFAVERAATIKSQVQTVRDHYRLLTGGELGKANRLLGPLANVAAKACKIGGKS